MNDFFPPSVDAPFRVLLTVVMFLPIAIPVCWIGTILIRDGIRNARDKRLEERREAYREGTDE